MVVTFQLKIVRMNPAKLDHIVIGAASLEQGVAWAQTTLGVTLPRGGQHVKMCTHNCVMRLDTPPGKDIYLEVIAIDPQAPAVQRPRWFGLDNPRIRQALVQRPQLLTWAVNTPDIHAALGNVCAGDFAAPFTIEAMHRDALRWQVGFAGDGELVDSGLFPLVLQWETPTHPARVMTSLGCALRRVAMVSTNAVALRAKLLAIGALDVIDTIDGGEVDELIVTLQTPLGECCLSNRLVD